MVLAEIVTLFLYAVSIMFLPEYFGEFYSCWALTPPLMISPLDLSFVLSVRFAWKVAVMVAVSAMPLWLIKVIRSRVAPASSSKLL